jgi:tRNA-dihydrouridine synthase B
MSFDSLLLKNPVILAPMAGITDLPYRRLMKSFGAGLVFTEMVSANGMVRSGARTRDLLSSHPEERPLGIQLFGDDPAILGEAVRMVQSDGDLVDLNMGCPVNKVVRSGAGSALLRDPLRVASAVRAMRRATFLPLTVKIRSGWDAGSINFLEIARICVSEGVDAITLHPRTRAQGFGGRADWTLIGLLKEAIPIPVIGSGDIFCADDAIQMMAQTGCDGVMIGRGGYGNPWLVRDILLRRDGHTPAPPTLEAKRSAALRHIDLFLESYPERKAVRDLRKHLAWYSRGLCGATGFRARINQVLSIADMRSALDDLFQEAFAAESSA